MKPSGAFGAAIQTATILAEQAAVAITHVDTGSLRASHRGKVNGLRGVINIDPGSVNPRSKQKPAEYGYYEHMRGGEHAFYQRVEREDGMRIARAAGQEFLRGMP